MDNKGVNGGDDIETNMPNISNIDNDDALRQQSDIYNDLSTRQKEVLRAINNNDFFGGICKRLEATIPDVDNTFALFNIFFS